jgi:hypothetical protein
MRLVLRVLLFEFTLSSALLLAGWVRLAVQIWPFARDSLKAASGDWLTIAALWWVLTGAVGALLLVAKIAESEPRTGSGTGCRCGVCMAHGVPVTSGCDRVARV